MGNASAPNAVSSVVVANNILKLAAEVGRRLDQLQLQKLVYIAHGWHLAVYDSSLTSDDVQAWDYGPVYPVLWNGLLEYGADPITGLVADDVNGGEPAKLNDEQAHIVRKVFDSYGEFSGTQLSNLTHVEGTPWWDVYKGHNSRRGRISPESIREHFRDLALNRSSNKASSAETGDG